MSKNALRNPKVPHGDQFQAQLFGTEVDALNYQEPGLYRSKPMKLKVVIATLAIFGAASPALAQQFYVVQDTSTKKCTVVEQKPTSTTTVVVGDGKVYTSRTEADAAIKTITVCKN
jgi:hypothetical protein